jgi:predicted DNA-binding transcriptional regulator YafY
MVDRLERLTNLVLLLREGRPRSLREIGDSVPGYPAEGEARRQAFERDKRTLRGGGVEITTVPIGGREQAGYVIRSEDFYLPELDLEADEQAALNLAVAGVHLGDPSGRDALWRLGLPASAGAQPVAQLPALPALAKLHGALRSHSAVSFVYRGEKRTMDPALLRFRAGWWYVVGFDRDRRAARTFRVDRFEEGPEVGPPGSADLPEGFDATAELPDEPWKMGESDPVDVDVLVDAPVAQLVVSELGAPTVLERRDDGSLVVRLEVTNTAALRNWVLELGGHAEVLSPAETRGEVVDWLGQIVSASVPLAKTARRTRATSQATLDGGARASEDAADREESRERHTGGKVDAGKRLQRLLAVLTWLARRGRAPVSELAERFAVSPEELVADLELAACCGLPPYTPDQLMEIVVDETEVVAHLGHELARPRRLTAAEGFALAASARAILAVPGSDPQGALGRALSKLESALGDRDTLRVDLGDPPHLDTVRRAVLGHEKLELLYYSVSSDEESWRTVDPVEVVAIAGRWYLDAFCRRSEGMRRFRVDRITEVRHNGEVADEHRGAQVGADPAASAFVPGPDATVARLVVDADSAWVVESVPIVSSRVLAPGRTEVTLGVSSVTWFERLLLRLGPHVQVTEPPELAEIGRDAARRLLERYGRD